VHFLKTFFTSLVLVLVPRLIFAMHKPGMILVLSQTPYHTGTGIRLLLPQIIPLQYQCSYQYYTVVIPFFAKYCQKLKELSENRIFFVNSLLRKE
jgi:hypothetical protein